MTLPLPTKLTRGVGKIAQKEEREKRDAEQLAKAKKLSAKDSFIGGITGLGISYVLYIFAQAISASFDGQAVPENYQARQISITVRTIVTGLAYLATFVYAANGTGLVALAGQKWLDKLTVGGSVAGDAWKRNTATQTARSVAPARIEPNVSYLLQSSYCVRCVSLVSYERGVDLIDEAQEKWAAEQADREAAEKEGTGVGEGDKRID